MSENPDWIYDPENWEVTYEWSERAMLAEDNIYVGEMRRFATLLRGPDRWAANVVLTRDEDGDPDETEIRWFNTEAEALAAVAKSTHVLAASGPALVSPTMSQKQPD